MSTNSIDAQINPTHYKSNHESQLETIDVVIAFDLNFLLGNVIKYVTRAGKKKGRGGRNKSRILDLKKAVWYLEKEIFRLQAEEDRDAYARAA